MTKSMKRSIIVALSLFGCVGCDQATKGIAREALHGSETISFLGDLVRFQHAENPGAFLSFGADMNDSLRFWIFTALVIGFLMWASFRLFKDFDMYWGQTVGWTLVVSGGIGNVIDRVVRGTVTDFMMVGLGPVHTGIFNVADMAIMAGIGCLFFWSKKTPNAPLEAP